MDRPAIVLPDVKLEGLERGYHDGLEDGDTTEVSKPPRCGRANTTPSILVIAKLILLCAAVVFGIDFISNPGFQISGCKLSGCGHSHDSGSHRDSGLQETCKSSVLLRETRLDFRNTSQFALVQVTNDNQEQYGSSGAERIHTLGEVHVRPADPNSGSDIRVELAFRGSHSQIPTTVESQQLEDASIVILDTPSWLKDSAMVAPETYCIDISATVWIPSNIALSKLEISTETLSVIFHPGLDYAAGNHTTDISSQPNTSQIDQVTSSNPRETVIHVRSATVTGTYPLYDLLSITTISGSISITITPKPASPPPTPPKPATLHLASTSGTIDALTSTHDVPNRDYRSTISTRSGSITTTLLHGLSTTIDSTSGDLTAHLHPHSHINTRSAISTHLRSGSAHITVHPSLSHPASPLRNLYALHRQTSGSLDLYYPSQWQGTVEGYTRSGGLDVQWEGLRVVRWAGRFFEGVRGEGDGVLSFEDGSGGVRLRGGGKND